MTEHEAIFSIPHSTLARRVQASVIDGLILGLGFIGLSAGLSNIEGLPGEMKFGFALGVLVFYEPFFLTFKGSTIGQLLRGIRVRKLLEDKKLSFVAACLRFWIKALTGPISFFVLMASKNRQALHDLALNSCVVLLAPGSSPSEAWYAEPDEDEGLFEYPSRWRRVLVIAAYVFPLLILSVVLQAVFLSNICWDTDRCSLWENAIKEILSWSWFLASCGLVFYAWRGNLYGARKRPIAKLD